MCSDWLNVTPGDLQVETTESDPPSVLQRDRFTHGLCDAIGGQMCLRRWYLDRLPCSYELGYTSPVNCLRSAPSPRPPQAATVLYRTWFPQTWPVITPREPVGRNLSIKTCAPSSESQQAACPARARAEAVGRPRRARTRVPQVRERAPRLQGGRPAVAARHQGRQGVLGFSPAGLRCRGLSGRSTPARDVRTSCSTDA